jgi:hypothetical protein
VAFTILSFQCACDFAQGLEVGCGELRDTDPSMDASRWEVSHASNGVTQTKRRQRERDVSSIERRGNRGWGSLLDLHLLVMGRWNRG